ncbi:N-acetylmuramoyl-L-alanine amidase [Sagittula sp. MA-2]|uniref:N-acetylmuramoyl-L-alanine amidase n=1 Tax=Sagittula sp. MA-2 TaxID=3048007 RepID=UPI0024C3BBB6|nr:N-acetylmuramoyl-L-alanine amidase [Sagittula sp. MA-2]WHZ34898.1 N-acetylmuramoyl-L-alanine amidase [Sagittula sp. MA-2]
MKLPKIAALSVLLLCPAALWAEGMVPEPAPLKVPGEITVELSEIDQKALRPYAQPRITHITFHHEGFAGTDAALFRKASAARDRQSISQRVRNINHDHVANAGLGMIAYHYAVDKTGQIAKGRPVRYAPATKSTVHGGTEKADFTGHFAVVALGDFNHETLTDVARLSYIRVMSEAQRAYRVPTANIRPHLHYASTSCPGEHIMAEADDLPLRVLVFGLQAELAVRGCGPVEPDGVWGKASGRALDRLVSANRASYAPDAIDDAALFTLLDDPALRCQ